MDSQRKAQGFGYLQLPFRDQVKGNSICREADEGEIKTIKTEGRVPAGTALPFWRGMTVGKML